MSTSSAPSSSSPSRLIVALAWIIFAVIWFGPLGYRALIHSDEGRYAEIALEMMRTGDWVTPRLNGLLYFEKPALQYWLTALSYHVFGINEFAARFWPALSGFLTAVAVSFTAKRLWGSRSGHLAGLISLSMVWVITNSHLLTLDMGLTFFLTAALCGLLIAAHETTPRAQHRWMLLAWAAMAGAMLSKGLIGLVIPGAAFTFYSLFARRWAQWKLLRWVSGPALFLLLTVPWFYLVSARNPGFAHFFFIHEHFERFLTHEHNREGPIWYFVPLLIIGVLPWLTLVPGAIRAGLKLDRGQSFHTTGMLLAWSGFIFVFFSVSGSKLPSYILPMFPALALLLARYLGSESAPKLRWHLLVPAVIWIVIGGLSTQLPRFVHGIPMSDLNVFIRSQQFGMALYLVLAAAAGILLVRRQLLPGIACVAFGSLLATSVVMLGHDNYARLKTSKYFAHILLEHMKPGMPVYSVRTYDQTLPFYIGRTVTLVEYEDEFQYGETAEPERWMHSVAEFETAWRSAPQGMAYMAPDAYASLMLDNLPMTPIYQDSRRIVVIKPAAVTKP